MDNRYLIVGNAQRPAMIGAFDYMGLLSQLLSAGLTYAADEAQAKQQQKLYEAEQARQAAAAAAAAASGGGSGNITQYLPYIAIGAVLLILVMRR